MMTSGFIIDVSEADFEYEVLVYSQDKPVVVDFWADWCNPCKMLGPVLEKLANEAQGGFRLAKVDVDANQRLAIRFGVTSIPSVKAFRNGEVAAEFSGLRPEPALREFLRALAPSPVDLELEKGNSLLAQSKAAGAEAAFLHAIQEQPGRPEIVLGLGRAVLMQGRAGEAIYLLDRVAPSKEYRTAQVILPLAQALHRLETGQRLAGEDPLDAAYENALRLTKRGNIEAAMDGLLDILRENKRYRGGLAHQALLGLLEMLGDANPMARGYRNELALVLF